MKTYLNVSAITSPDGNVDRYGEFVSAVRQDGRVEEWTCTKEAQVGDVVFFYFGQPLSAIVAIGLVESEPWYKEGRFDWKKRSGACFCDYSPVWLLRRHLPLKEACNRLGLADWYDGKPYQDSRRLDAAIVETLLHEIMRVNPEPQGKLGKLPKTRPTTGRGRPSPSAPPRRPGGREFDEGGIREITLELRKRDPRLRAQALAEYGHVCRACKCDFVDIYGELGEGYIEVHHLVPLSEPGGTRKSTVKEVDVVCANCHRMLHRTDRVPISVDDLRTIIERRRAEKEAFE
jgi:hypothetical protein